MKKENEILKAFCERLRKVSKDFSPDLVVRFMDGSFVIGVKETNKESQYFNGIAFGSEVTIYPEYKSEFNFRKRNARINYGTTGTFDPTFKNAYWRTIHAAAILKHWDEVLKLVSFTYNRLV